MFCGINTNQTRKRPSKQISLPAITKSTWVFVTNEKWHNYPAYINVSWARGIQPVMNGHRAEIINAGSAGLSWVCLLRQHVVCLYFLKTLSGSDANCIIHAYSRTRVMIYYLAKLHCYIPFLLVTVTCTRKC